MNDFQMSSGVLEKSFPSSLESFTGISKEGEDLVAAFQRALPRELPKQPLQLTSPDTSHEHGDLPAGALGLAVHSNTGRNPRFEYKTSSSFTDPFILGLFRENDESFSKLVKMVDITCPAHEETESDTELREVLR
ncbi:hypothetical protein PanWU01x14_320430 [Parasponia andersonii]|uniref:Uncharacterized protein n=1 Tax=Parasponia andersonii TaxID=3476 RepID=A0A2P5ALK7_PARAD|nr:hypothetical protein PanWU01x14_320430 [Parasponia andersonii]